MKQLYLLLLFGFVFTDQYGQDVTRYTPTGIPVYAIDYLEWASEEEIAAANVLWQDDMPGICRTKGTRSGPSTACKFQSASGAFSILRLFFNRKFGN